LSEGPRSRRGPFTEAKPPNNNAPIGGKHVQGVIPHAMFWVSSHLSKRVRVITDSSFLTYCSGFYIASGSWGFFLARHEVVHVDRSS
jgi:hypothetical protein